MFTHIYSNAPVLALEESETMSSVENFSEIFLKLWN